MDGRTLKHATLAGLYLAALTLLLALATRNFLGAGTEPTAKWTRPSPKLARLGGLARLKSRNFAPFESGNIGRIERLGSRRIVLNLRSDNDDALPKFWRQWFYLHLDELPTKKPVEITIVGAGQWSYYLPFYSYDNVQWFQFEQRDVTKPNRYALRIKHRFKHDKVWIARYVPYTYGKLNAYLKHLESKPFVELSDIGLTPEGRRIPLLTITNERSRQAKTRVLIHARTHPGEVGSSFLLEGMIDYLLGPAAEAKRLRDRTIFSIVPMLNVDGVVAGNNRVNTRGINLEGKWYPAPGEAFELDESRVPAEVRLLHGLAEKLAKGRYPVSVALNLHSSAGEPEDNAFFFPHFGPRTKGYAKEEASLYGKQRRFIDLFCDAHGRQWFNEPPSDGSRSFLAKAIPESWWWRNFKDDVMALTIESSYGLAGGQHRWIKPADMRKMGASLAKAIWRYQRR
jgi:hypothetical protein